MFICQSAIIIRIFQQRQGEDDNHGLKPITPPELYGPTCRIDNEPAQSWPNDDPGQKAKIQSRECLSTLVQEEKVDDSVSTKGWSNASKKAPKEACCNKGWVLIRVYHRCGPYSGNQETDHRPEEDTASSITARERHREERSNSYASSSCYYLIQISMKNPAKWEKGMLQSRREILDPICGRL